MPLYEIGGTSLGMRMRPLGYRFRPEMLSLGDALTPDAGVEYSMARTEEQSKVMKKRLMEAAAQVAVSQLAISIGAEVAFSLAAGAAATATAAGAAALAAGATASTAAIAAGSCVPIIGWAVAAVIAIGTLIGGHIGKRRAKEEVDKAKREIQQYGDAVMGEIRAVQMSIAEEEFPAGEALANSGAPLDGLGDLGAFLGIRKKQITRAVAKAQVATIKKPVQAVLKTGEIGAKLVGDKRGEEKAKKWQKKWEANSDRVEKMFARKLENPYKMIASDIDKIGRTVSGQEIVHVTREKTRKLIAAAKKDMDEFRDKTMSAMATPEYRDAVRTNIARGLRGDPQFAAQVNELSARSKMVDAEFMSSQQVAAVEAEMPNTAAKSSGGLAAAAATFASAFFLLRP